MRDIKRAGVGDLLPAVLHQRLLVASVEIDRLARRTA